MKWNIDFVSTTRFQPSMFKRKVYRAAIRNKNLPFWRLIARQKELQNVREKTFDRVLLHTL